MSGGAHAPSRERADVREGRRRGRAGGECERGSRGAHGRSVTVVRDACGELGTQKRPHASNGVDFNFNSVVTSGGRGSTLTKQLNAGSVLTVTNSHDFANFNS